MSEDEKNIDRIDTVPPPAGEDDAYSAPTRVGEMAAEKIAAMMKATELPKPEPPPKVDQAPSASTAKAEDGPLPAVYRDEEIEDSNAATLLHPRAKPPPVVRATSPIVDDVMAPDSRNAALAPPSMDAMAETPESLAPKRRVDVFLLAVIVALVGVVVWLLRSK